MNKTNHWTSYDIAYKLFEDMLLNLYISDPRSYEHYRTSSWYKTWKNSGPYLNPWPLRYRCSALPTELTSQLGARYYFDPKFIKYCILKERARSLLFLWGGGGGEAGSWSPGKFPEEHSRDLWPLTLFSHHNTSLFHIVMHLVLTANSGVRRNVPVEKWGLQKVFSDEKQPFFGYLLPIWIT